MKGKYKNRTRVAKGYGPRHALNAQEGSEAVPGELPTPPVQEETQSAGPSLKKIYPNLLRAFGQAGSELAGQSPADWAKLAISLGLGGGEELPAEPGAVPEHIWNSWEMVKDPVFDPETGELAEGDVRRDEAGNHYQFLGSHRYVAGGTSEPGGGTLHAIVRPVEAPGTEAQATLGYMKSVKPDFLEDLPPVDPNKPYSQLFLKSLEGTSDQAGWDAMPPEAQQAHLDWLDSQYPTKQPPEEEPPFTPNVPRYARGKMSVGPRHADNAFQSGTSDTSGYDVGSGSYNPQGFYGWTLQPQDVAQMRSAMDAPGRSSLSPIEETLAQNPDAQSFYFDQTSGNYVPFGGGSGYQEGTSDTPDTLDEKQRARVLAQELARAQAMNEMPDAKLIEALHESGGIQQYAGGESNVSQGDWTGFNNEFHGWLYNNVTGDWIGPHGETSGPIGTSYGGSSDPTIEPTPLPQNEQAATDLGDLPVSNLSAQAPDQSGQQGGGNMQLINELGYNPSYAYGSSGSGVPTQNAAGMGGQLIGGVLGNLAFPVLGGLIGSQLGKYGGSALARMFQAGPAPGSPSAPQTAGAAPSGGGGLGDLFPQGTGGLGEPMGYFPWYDPGNTGSSSYAPFTGGVGGEGGTLAGGSNIGAGPLPGSFAGLGSFGGGDLGSYGGAIGEHTPSFRAWIQGQGFPNVASYNAAMAGPPGPSMAMAGGGGAPVGLQHATGGHITTAQEGDTDVKKKVASTGHDFSEDKQLWDKILTATYGVQTPTEMLGPVPLKDDEDEEPMVAQRGRNKIAVGPRHADNAHSTDTVPAMLTPREAVLNRNAAELAGRGKIQELNAEGNQLADEGVDLAGKDKNMKSKYQRGAARIAPVPLTGPKPTARADLAGIMKYLPMGALARSAQSQAVQPKIGVQGYQAGTAATDPLSMYQSKLSTSPLGGGQSLGGGPGPSPFPRPSPSPNPGPGPMPVGTMPPPTPMGQPTAPPRPGDNDFDPTKSMTTPVAFNNWAANAGAPGFVTQPVPPQGAVQPTPPPNITTRTPPPLPSNSFFPPPASAARPVGFQGGSGDVIGSPQPGTQFANVQYSAPQINIAALKNHLQSQGIQPNQISGIINQIAQYRSSTPAASYGEGSQVSQDLGPLLESATQGMQRGITAVGYPPEIAPDATYHYDNYGGNWETPGGIVSQSNNAFVAPVRYWRGSGNVMPMAGMGPVMGARPFVHPVRPVPPVRF